MIFKLILFFIVGTVFGSFGGNLIENFKDNITKEKIKSFLFGHSQCPYCGHKLKLRNLIPIISYIKQKGKCEYCGHKIPLFYPLYEILSGIIFVSIFFLYLKGIINFQDFPFLVIITRLIGLLSIFDIYYFQLHIFVRFILQITIFFFLYSLNHQLFIISITLGLLRTLFFGILYIFFKIFKKKEILGLGDLFFIFSLGSISSYLIFRNFIPSDILNYVIFFNRFLFFTSVTGIISYIFSKDKKLPFIPILISGYIIAIISFYSF